MEENKRNLVNLPKRKNTERITREELERQNDLMKLIIDSNDEEIKLKVDGDQYRKMGIHDEWRQDSGEYQTSYFSYQEKAAKDFIYRFNRCGILSDQVGMGKTIEAGMIISELVYRKDLGSLLILVPNETMSEKWENELAKKFGLRNIYADITIMKGQQSTVVPASSLPKVFSIKTMADLYMLIFNANDSLVKKEESLNYKIVKSAEKIYDQILTKAELENIRKQISALLVEGTIIESKEFKMHVLKEVYNEVIKKIVTGVSKDLKLKLDKNYDPNNSNTFYHIVDMYLDSPITEVIKVNTIMNRLFNKQLITNSIVDEFVEEKEVRGKKLIEKINQDFAAINTEEEAFQCVERLKLIAKTINKIYSILVVSKVITHNDNPLFNLLDSVIINKYEFESLKYCLQSSFRTDYKVIDLLIDMGYYTLIVDEAHDYIRISHKRKMKDHVTQYSYESDERINREFSDLDNYSSTSIDAEKYFVYPLFNDYYYVERDSLYVKIKELSERSFRKIFMTATPIKSDMVDFYLLYLLADNTDASTLRSIRDLLDEQQIHALSNVILLNINDVKRKALNSVTHEDIVVKYIYEAYKDQTDSSSSFEERIKSIINTCISSNKVSADIVNKICKNSVRIKFQKLFTIEGREIQTISELVSSEKGIREWQNMYTQLGIRSTRHQTFRLDEEHLDMINPLQRMKYTNLPTWSRRNGIICYINKEDSYFDVVVKNKIEERIRIRNSQTIDEDEKLYHESIEIPEQEKISKLEKEKNLALEELEDEDFVADVVKMKEDQIEEDFNNKVALVEREFKPKKSAFKIFKYINDQLTGVLETADYNSRGFEYDEFKLHMVASLMTGELIGKNGEPIKIEGRVLLFADQHIYKDVFKWLSKDADPNNKMSEKELKEYAYRYNHRPIWYYNNTCGDASKRWKITTDIKSLSEKSGNYIIVIEPNKYEEGVDLQKANTLINFDIKFCPLKMEQRIGRIDRVKLDPKQTNLKIISFTPLNDMSGFMVDFIANDLKMFSCWRGDTTGIVSMPIGTKTNSATFEGAIEKINNAYKALYQFDSKKYLEALAEISSLGKNFDADKHYFDDIDKIVNSSSAGETVLQEFDYLKKSNDAIKDIILNTKTADREKGDDGKILFGFLKSIAIKKGMDEGKIKEESYDSSTNDLSDLQDAIVNYYNLNIKHFNDRLKALNEGKQGSSKGSGGRISTDVSNKELAREQERLTKLKEQFQDEYDYYKGSMLAKAVEKTTPSLDIDIVNDIVNPILKRFETSINSYLDLLLNLFDKLCAEVREKSLNMSKFISYLTIDELKVMVKDYE